MTDLTAAQGWTFEVKPAIQAMDITPDWRVVVMDYAANLSDLLAAAPQVQFIVFSPFDLGAGANLSVIREQSEQEAFMAGYITVLTAADWRSGGLLPAEEPLATSFEDAFSNGAAYYCGICNSFYSPIVLFPDTARIPAGSPQATWQPVVDELNKDLIYVMYVAPQVSSTELLTALAQQGFKLVGGQTPAEEFKPFWIATIKQDLTPALQQAWTDITSGVTGKVYPAMIVLTDINNELLPAGRQRLVEETLQEIQAGQINPLSVPQ